jgi:uncharacterized membrane protein
VTGSIRAVALLTAVGAAVAGGVFFAFSTFVMAGLGRLPAAQGAAAMQQINLTAVRPAFMTLLFGTAAGCVVLAVHAARAGTGRSSAFLVAGAGLYLVGAIGLTIAYNVPRNDTLAALDPSAAATPAAWADYLTAWTRANHVRTAASIAAAAAFLVAALERV